MYPVEVEALSAETRAGMKLAHPPPGEEVCITGISGTFPESENVIELRDNLFAKRELITLDNRRWDISNVAAEIPKGSGKIKEICKFDAAFFGIHSQQANGLDPQSRILFEKTYEAIVDAGVNPEELKGTCTGVFVGACLSESETALFNNVTPINGRSILSATRIGYANRISYWLKVNGPSYSVDSACSSSMYALDHAFKAIRDGHCNQAVVAGANLVLLAKTTKQFFDLGVLSKSSKCRPFDNEADGYVRSEAVSALFLQKSRDARRVYATIIHSKTNNDGYKSEGITFPSGPMQQQLLEEFYRECDVDPSTVGWVEAHGTGTAVGDPEECSALAKVFCAGRNAPLLVGSIKSNLGHTEPVSGLCSIAKAVISLETGLIPANINLKNLKETVPSLIDGRLKVVTETQPWSGGLVGINSFGFGGANAHVCLRWNEKAKMAGGVPSDGLPRLVGVSGRTKEGVEGILLDMESRPVDAELVRLYQAVNAVNTPSHLFRGFALLACGKSRHHVKPYDSQARRRPVWLVLPGVGSAGCAGDVLALPALAKAVDECQRALPAGVPDLRRLVCQDFSQLGPEEAVLALAAFQIGMVDVLRSVGVRPERIVGYGLGQLAAGYADECFTLGQAMRCAHACSVTLREMCARKKNDDGSELPERFRLANNSRRADVFAWDQGVGDDIKGSLQKRLRQVLPNPKPPSKRWVSSSEERPEFSSADFLWRCLSASTSRLQDDTSSGAIVFTLSPREGAVDDVLMAFGQMFLDGADLPLAEIYPTVEFPVSRGTPMIAPFVRWCHDRDWHVDKTWLKTWDAAKESVLKVNISQSRHKFYTGHVVDGRNLFPATGYLFFVWQSLKKKSEKKGTIVFEDIRFLRSTNIPAKGNVFLSTSIQPMTGLFEVEEGGTTVVSGRIYIAPSEKEPLLDIPLPKRADADVNADVEVDMSSRDIYKELRLRGYDYSGLFRGLVSADSTGRRGKIRWADNNWVAFMDNMLQMQILSVDTRGLFVPTSIARLTIDEEVHMQAVKKAVKEDAVEGEDAVPVLDVFAHLEAGVIRSGGIEVRGLYASAINRRKYLGEPVLEKQVFLADSIVPECTKSMSLRDAFCACVHVGLENHASVRVKAVELFDSGDSELLTPELARVLADLPLIQADLCVLALSGDTNLPELQPNVRVEHRALDLAVDGGATFVLGKCLLLNEARLRTAISTVGQDGFLLTVEPVAQALTADTPIDLLAEFSVEGKKLMLLRKRRPVEGAPRVLWIREADPNWLAELQTALAEDTKSVHKVVLVSQGEPTNGLLGFFNCLRKEPAGQNARCFLLDAASPPFDVNLPIYAERLAKDLAVNVLRDGRWGSYRHLPLGAPIERAVPHVYANVTTIGDLSSFRWLEGSIDPASCSNKQLVHVYVSPINFKDVMLATGRLPAEVVTRDRTKLDCLLGMEFAGRTPDGRRVMGMLRAGAMSTVVLAEEYGLWDVPDEWSLLEAATVPVVYGTALYALFEIGDMKRGDKVLIHAGSGGVGQAAIHLALHAGAEVFTTVGTPEKRAFIKQRFPQILDAHIGNSRDTSFEQLVLRETAGRGVDLVLNSLAEEKLMASLRCLARGGRFLEIGKFDIAANNAIGMSMFLKETSFHGVMLDTMSESRKRVLFGLLQRAIKDGAVVPLNHTVFPAAEVEQAFRFMGSGKHVGKVMLNIRDEEVVDRRSLVAPETVIRKATPKFSCHPQRTYVIVGGLGGFGLELADWLVLRGARQVMLSSRAGLRTGYQAARVRIWRSYGAAVVISKADVCTEEGVNELLAAANRMAPVAAIFNLAVVLRDAMFEQQTSAGFQEAAAPKALATRLLDTASRRLCPELAHFVVFSSVSCGRGNAGQTSYGAANSVMERVCEVRAQLGLPALAVQWGAVGQVGLVADMREDDREVVIGGTLPQRIGSCLTALDGFMCQGETVVASMVVAEKRASAGGGSMLDTVATILGIANVKTVSHQSTLAELGMDSMTAVEIKQTLEREYQVFLTPVEIRGLTLARVVALSAGLDQDASADAKQNADNEMGIAQLLRLIGDEKVAYSHTVTLDSAAQTTPRTALMIPGIEGAAASLQPLAAMLRAKTLCLQGAWTNDTLETVEDIARELLPYAMSALPSSAAFNIVGYSFGGLVALHLASFLEEAGHRGVVCLVDSSPDLMKYFLATYVTDPAGMEVSVLLSMLSIVQNPTAEKVTQMHAELIKLPSWSSRLQYALTVFDVNEYSARYQEDLANSYIRRLKATQSFSWSGRRPLEARVTLLRPFYRNLDLPADYGLEKYCLHPVEVHMYEEGHTSILENVDVAEVINNLMVDDAGQQTTESNES